jgi:lipopolysaccharide transport system ATP-binding protein
MSRDGLAIDLRNVTKTYWHHGSPGAIALGLVGLDRLLLRSSRKRFTALDRVSLQIERGERVAIIGRNGAGKTTLLRLVQGLYRATSGEVRVKGRVQSLMDLGIGFHPDFSGFDNIRSAICYNAVSAAERDALIKDIIEFCELGDFLHQPLRTYSAGMRMRVFFAAATAIVPEILVIDEVLGVGDQYLAARSAARLRDLALGGCTLLFVSHNNQQVIEFCERAVWLEAGRIVMRGPTLAVVKAYEEFTERLTQARHEHLAGEFAISQNINLREAIISEVLANQDETIGNVAGGRSRWPATRRIRIADCWAESRAGHGQPIDPGAPFDIIIDVEVAEAGKFDCCCAIVIFSADGHWLTRIISPPQVAEGPVGRRHRMRMHLERPLLVSGSYVMSASLHSADKPLVFAERFDLVSRSFALEIGGPAEPGAALASLPTEWQVEPASSG